MKQPTRCRALIAALVVMPALSSAATTSNTASGSISVTLYRTISVVKNRDLGFGTLVKPSGAGTGTGVVSAADPGVGSVTGGVGRVGTSGVTSGKFTISGEGGRALTVAVSATTLKLSTNQNVTLTLTPTTDLQASPVLGGSLGAAQAGSLVVNVGGSVALTGSTTAGSYSGSLTLTATYN